MWRNVQALLWMAQRHQHHQHSAIKHKCALTYCLNHFVTCVQIEFSVSLVFISWRWLLSSPKRIKVNVLQDLQSVLSLAGYCREQQSRIKNEQNKMWGLEMWWAWLSSACVGSTMGTESGCGWKFLKISLCMSFLLFTSSTYIKQCQSKSSR